MSKSWLDPNKYEPDEDGMVREIVGSWVREKHARVERYISISRGVRKKFIGANKAGATFIDLYSGPGRARIADTTTVIDGSPVVAWRKSVESGAPFTQVQIADAERVLVDTARIRLARAGAQVSSEAGPAIQAVDAVLNKLDRYGLHFAFLDPYNLAAIPFEVIRKLASIRRMDILIHVSVQDLQRNLRKYVAQDNSPLDAFAPGWREQVGDTQDQLIVRGKILEHWARLLKAEGMNTAETHELVTGSKNQPLYWLAFAARHDRALYFWEQVRDVGPEQQLSFI
jgi:three-Cys-motif partner protein